MDYICVDFALLNFPIYVFFYCAFERIAFICVLPLFKNVIRDPAQCFLKILTHFSAVFSVTETLNKLVCSSKAS
jgi:hypothetical protein